MGHRFPIPQTKVSHGLPALLGLILIFILRSASAAATTLPSLPPLAPDYVRSLKSKNSDVKTSVNFINSSGDPVDIYWVNYEGGLAFYQHLGPGQTAEMQTYAGHPWLIYDDRTASYIVGFLPIDTAAQALIKMPGAGASAANKQSIAGESFSAAADVNASAAAAASFDCSKANTPVEKTICSDPMLAGMDREMGTLYRKQIQNSKNAKAWEADQRAWLARRDRCKDDDGCLRSAYRERLTILRAHEPANQWAGKWWRVDFTGFYGAGLDVTKVTSDGFDFSMQASSGANTGDLEGKAVISSPKKARWRSPDKDFANCSLNFDRVLNRLTISGQADETSCGAGAGVDYAGTYVASGQDPNAAPDLLSLGVAQTLAQDDELRKLMGKDYDAMAKTANLTTEDENLDGNGAKVVGMFVRGLACDTKSVLMFDSKGHLWAAVWEPAPGSSDVIELHYYTNVAGDKNTLPKTIAAAQEACPGETVRVRMMP